MCARACVDSAHIGAPTSSLLKIYPVTGAKAMTSQSYDMVNIPSSFSPELQVFQKASHRSFF